MPRLILNTFRTPKLLSSALSLNMRRQCARCGFRTWPLFSHSQPRTSRSVSYVTWATIITAASSSLLYSLVQKENNVSADTPLSSSPSDADVGVFQDPDTKINLPIVLIGQGFPYQVLVGAGVRTVTFLGLQVYVAGLYMDRREMSQMSTILGKNHSSLTPQDILKDESIAEKILNQDIERVIRIEPIRKTDFGHLRDGFNRTLTARLRKEAKQRQMNEEEKKRIQGAMNEFKSLFPNRALKPGSALLVVCHSNGDVSLIHDKEKLATMPASSGSKWIGVSLWMGYIGEGAISDKAKRNFAEGLCRYL